MSLKENILKKILIKNSASAVTSSLSRHGDISGIDKKNAVLLLEAAGYRHEHIRDLDLYYKGIDHDRRRIVVLDAEFAIYNSSIEDVALRKSPTVKEMISIRNMKKIIWDSGVVLKKKTDTVDELAREAIDFLDLSVNMNELEDIMYHSMACIVERDMSATLEGILIFAELLGWESSHLKVKNASVRVFGKNTSTTGSFENAYSACISEAPRCFGPAVSFNGNSGKLCLTERIFDLDDPDQKALLEKFMSDCENSCMEGEAVFRRLCEMARSVYGL
jgi:hypothetical protein